MGVEPARGAPGGKEAEQVLGRAPGAEAEHGFVAARTEGKLRVDRGGLRAGWRMGWRRGRLFRWLPGVFFGRGKEGFLVEQGADAVEADLGGGMEEAEGADAGEVRRQDVLEEAGHEILRLQVNLGVLPGAGVAISPAQAAVGQLGHEAVAGGGFEDVTGEVAQGVMPGAGVLHADVPGGFPDRGGELLEEVGMLLEQTLFEEGAAAQPQRYMVEEELFGGDPGAAVGAQAAAGDEVMNVGVEDQGAAPGVEDAQHAELGAEAFGIGGQIVQSLGTAGEEQVQPDVQMGADPQA